MARLYNDSSFLYNAINLTYNGSIIIFATGSGTGVGTESATRIYVPLRTATGSGLGTQTVIGARLKTNTATGSGLGTQTATWTKSLIFRPPAEDRFPWINYCEFTPAHRLFAHLEQGYRARNIYRLIDGSYTTNDPGDPSIVEKLYLGAHANFVSETEKAQLVSAGYTVT